MTWLRAALFGATGTLLAGILSLWLADRLWRRRRAKLSSTPPPAAAEIVPPVPPTEAGPTKNVETGGR